MGEPNKVQDYSSTIGSTGVAQELFPQVPFASFSERFIINLSSTAYLWVNFFGDDAAADTPGSIPLAPLASLQGPVAQAWSIVGDAGTKFTAGQR